MIDGVFIAFVIFDVLFFLFLGYFCCLSLSIQNYIYYIQENSQRIPQSPHYTAPTLTDITQATQPMVSPYEIPE
jgi:hypothetical protein